MMSIKLQNDLKYADSILKDECKDIFRKIYTSTNENLLLLFSKLNLDDKDVLSVLSSSDYLYMSYLFGARHVDSFDINPLTYRFFYLRKWLIKSSLIDIGILTAENLLEIIENTEIGDSENEKESLVFWKEILMKMSETNFFNNPLFISSFNPFNFFYNDKLVDLSNKLSLINPTFYNIDICEYSTFYTGRKYDYVFLSNILDYNRKKESLDVIVNNLMGLTNNRGKVVCTHLPQTLNEDFSQVICLEQKCFERAFDYDQIVSDEIGKIYYYQYTKR